MLEATLCFLLRGGAPREILLGWKKTGLGAGKYNGFGGKLELGETPVFAAVRELQEETGVCVATAALKPMAHLTFYFPAQPAWNQIVHVYVVETWSGEPVETAEMRPAWFALTAIPFSQMWQDDVLWLPRVLAGERLQARFTFAADNETVAVTEIAEWRIMPIHAP